VTASHHVLPTDEERHIPTGEDLWNESYYCDFVHADGTWGGWLRLGLYPNRKVAWWTTWIVWPGRPGLCSVDYHAPVPPGAGLVSESEGLGRVEVDLRRPLEEFRLAADVRAVLVQKPEDAYEGAGTVPTGSGSETPARLGVDLTWTTDGSPYHYDVTTRYEIPCLVAGTVTIDDETLSVDGQGQRDHSWGVRDWWAFGWCWSSARLQDGTRIHLADIRVPGLPVSFGYVQVPGPSGSAEPATVHPISGLSVTEDEGPHRFPKEARLEIQAGGVGGKPPPVELVIDVTPLAFGPVFLRNDDGRSSRFPRALVRYETGDGRAGHGWIEWNQPDSTSS
jgi:hypothetical protein